MEFQRQTEIKLPDIHFWHGRFVAQAGAWVAVDLPQPQIQMHFSLEGGTTYSLPDATKPFVRFKSQQHNLFLLPGNNFRVQWKAKETVELFSINVSPSFFFAHLPDNHPLTSHFQKGLDTALPGFMSLRNLPVTSKMIAVLFEILHCSEAEGYFRDLFVKAKVIELLALQFEQYESLPAADITLNLKETDKEKMHQARLILTENLEHAWSLKDLAHQVGTNEFNLKKYFKEVFGKPVFGYLHDLRMEASMQMLKEPGNRIAEISLKTGYKNPTHFTAAFKKYYGILPNKVRIALLVCLLVCSSVLHAQVLRKRTTMLMGGRFDITIVDKDSLAAEMHIDTVIAEISRIEHLISDWKPASQVSQVNASAGIRPVKVDLEVLLLTERALELSKLTGGAFDISFAAMDRIWKFDGSMTRMPTAEAIRKSVEKVGYQNVVIDKKNSTVFLKKKGMKIGFGALGEGYATDKCREIMRRKGVQAGIVNGSGDMSAWGKQPDGTDWMIGINDPKNSGKLFAVFPLQQGAVVTSGSYEKYVTFNGKRFSHIINPATGYPATGLTSVTVFGPSAEVANGFSTSLMVLGRKPGLELISRFPAYSCLMITDENEVVTSGNLNIADFKTEEAQ